MRKSLVPLIIILFCIVLLTAIIVKIKPETRQALASESSKFKKPRAIYLSNIETVKEAELPKIRQHIMDEKKILNLLIQAYSKFDEGKLSEAESKVKTVLVFQAKNNEALSLLGKIYYLQNEYEQAEIIFRRQIAANKKSASAYNNLGQVLLKQKKYYQATKCLLVAQELDPESGLIALNLSVAYSQQGKKKESLASFQKAFKLMGTKVISVANHPALDNIREEKVFIEILKKAGKGPALSKKMEAVNE
ncbi:MAG: tetratricopeptide repeat protein [Victivallales bacterium]|nr:tetratricopeptide repeat protein [Victivallales bacterium]